MKKALLIIVIILLALLVVPIINYIGWSSQKKKPIDVIVVDKTVTSFKMDKHKSFNWVMKNDGFVDKSTGKSISYKDDYYGFLPTRPAKSRLWDKKEYRLAELIDLAEKADALYFTDTYGVFFNDWYQGATQTRRSRKLYGGLNTNDNLLIKEMKGCKIQEAWKADSDERTCSACDFRTFCKNNSVKTKDFKIP